MAFTRPRAAQIDFDVTNISDPLIRLNSAETGSADKDVGIVIERGDDTNVAMLYDESADQFVLVNTTEDGSTSGNVTISSYAGLQANAIVYGSLNDGTTTLTATATELNYTDGVTSAIQTQLDSKLALAGGTMSGAIAMGTNKITGMGDPTANQDAATKAYVDTQTSSIVTTTDIAGDTGTDTVTLGSDTLTFSGTANEIATAVTDNTVTISLPDDVTISSDLTVTGNLTVNGTTTTISTTNSIVSDSLIELNTGAGSNANDLGIVMERGSTGDNAIFAWDESADAFVMGTTTATGESTGDLTIANGELRLDTLRIDQSGTGLRMTNVGAFDNDGSDNFRIFATNDLQLKANGDSGGGLSIDVTNNDVTIDNDLRVSAGQFYYGGTAVTSTATELNLLDGVTGTLVTEAGTQTLTNKTLTSPTITGTGAIAGTFTGNITGDVTGNADTATALATARNIAGNSFDGTGDITIASTDLSDTSNLVRNNQNNTITSTTAGSSAAPEFELFRDITGADANYIGQIKFSADNDADQKTVFAKITGKIGDASDGSEDGIIEIAHQKAGSNNINVRMTSTEFKIMNGTDFDVETHDGSSTGLRLANTLVTATAAELNRLDGIGSAAVGLTDTQTLTNKTLTSPQVNTNIDLLAQADLRFYDSDDSNYVGFQAPATASGNILWTLPGSDGSANQVLATDGSGTLSFVDQSGGGAGADPDIELDSAVGDNATTDFSVTTAPVSAEDLLVTINGIVQRPTTDYTVSGTTITFGTAPFTGAVVAARTITASAVGPEVSADTTPQLGGDLDTNGNDVTFGDNDKAIFGAGSDLQIYHDGSNSIINDAGTGSLKFQYGGTDGVVFDSSGNVGIGTSSATQRLSVKGTNSTAGQTGADVTMDVYDDSTGGIDVGGAIGFRGNDGINSNVMFGEVSGRKENATSGNYASYMGFKTRADAGGLTERMRIDSSGNVGIGTSSPGELLHLSLPSGINDDIMRLSRSAGAYSFQLGVSSGTTSNLYISDNSNNKIIDFTSGGNVGIGTSSPRAKAEVYDANVSGTFNATDLSTWRVLQIRNNIEGGAGTAAGIAFGGDGTSDTETAGIVGISDNTTGGVCQLAFLTSSGNTSAEAMRIDSSGNVGIGTSSPTTDITKFGGSALGLSVAAGQPAIAVRATANAQYVGYFGQASTNTYLGAIGGGSLIIQTGTSGTERMRLHSGGGLSIGTSNIYSNAFISILPDDTNRIINTRSFDTNSQYHLLFQNNSGTAVGNILVTTTSTAFNTSSDYRLKTAVTYDWDATTRLKQLRPARFEWIVDGDDAVPVDGFLAHEVQTVVPEAITGTHNGMRDEEYEVSAATGDIYTPAIEAVLDEDGNEVTPAVAEVIHSTDAERPEELAEGQQWRETTAAVMGTRSVPDYQGIDQSKLVPLLVKTIQELEARITALETAE